MKNSIIAWWIPFVLLCTIAFFLQNHIYVNKDEAFLLHTAKMMLEGQTYAKSIFEPNPPLILYLQMPVVLLSKLINFNILYILRMYIIILTFISISCSYFCIQKLFGGKTPLSYFLLYLLVYILLFLPATQFAQRENILMILIIP
jgi:hypothetical protein